MPLMEVLIHVPGDREAIIEEIKKRNFPHKQIRNYIWIENTYIYLGSYGHEGNRLCLETDSAKSGAGKPIQRGLNGYGGNALPFAAQVKIFNILKRAVIAHRAEFYKKTEQEIQKKRAGRDSALEKIHGVINFEKNVLKEEHRLEAQISATIKFISGLQQDFPKSTFREKDPRTMDHGILALHIEKLKQILAYLKAEEIETVHILRGASTVRVDEEGIRVRIKKKHLRKLAAELRKFAADMNYFLKVWVKMFQITTEMRAHLREFYTRIFRLYSWYAALFKAESKK